MKILSIEEAANSCGKSQKTLRRAIASGKLKATKIQNHYRIEYNDLKKWLKNKPADNEDVREIVGIEDVVNWVDVSKNRKKDGWKNKKDRNGLNFVDLFSGAGGLSCGLVMAGFTPIASVEIMPEAVATYEYNFIEKKVLRRKFTLGI